MKIYDKEKEMEESQAQWLDIKKEVKGWQGCKNKKILTLK